MKEISEKELGNHWEEEHYTALDNLKKKPREIYTHFDVREIYADVFDKFPTKIYHSIINLPITPIIFFSEFTVVPIHTMPISDFIHYYGCTPLQLVTLENEGLVQTILVDDPRYYLQWDWFHEFINRRHGGIPPIDRISPTMLRLKPDFGQEMVDQNVLSDIRILGKFQLVNAISKMGHIKSSIQKEGFERLKNAFIDTDKSGLNPIGKIITINGIFNIVTGPILHGLGGIPNIGELDTFNPIVKALIQEKETINLVELIVRGVFWDSMQLSVPSRIENVQDVLDFHIEGIPKSINRTLSLLVKEIKNGNTDLTELNNIKSLTQDKIKEANIEFLKTCRSWKGPLIDTILEAGNSISPIGFPGKDKVKSIIKKKISKKSPFINEYINLKWTLNRVQ